MGGKLTNLNPQSPIADADIPAAIARDAEVTAAINAHLAAIDPHLQYLTQARGDARYERIYPTSFRATPVIGGTSQPLTAGSSTKIILGNEVEDTLDRYDPALSRLTIAGAETWQFGVNMTIQLATSGRLYLEIRRNGLTSPGLRLLDVVPSSGFYSVLVTPTFSFAANDYIELFCNCATTDATINASFFTHWSGLRIR